VFLINAEPVLYYKNKTEEYLHHFCVDHWSDVLSVSFEQDEAAALILFYGNVGYSSFV